MRSFLIFIGGVVTGAFLLFVFGLFLTIGEASSPAEETNKKTMFEKEGDCISEKSFAVRQVLDSGDALADEMKEVYSELVPTGLTVLFLCEDGKSYYDNQIIKIPSGKCAKQVGLFKHYSSTVPIVSICDK